MPIEILMPALSPTMEEGTLAKWLVNEGDTVESGDLLAEIETDKATMEFEAVDAGVIGKLLVAAGSENVKVNAPIALLLEEGEDLADALEQNKASAPAKVAVCHGSPTESETRENGGGEKGTPARAALAVEGSRIFATPLARRIAADKGIDLSTITGTGPRGRIVKRDVLALRKSERGDARSVPSAAASVDGARFAPQRSVGAGQSSQGTSALYQDREFSELPLDNMRKTIAARLTESKQTIPHFYLRRDINLDALIGARSSLNAQLADQGVKLSVNDFIIKACALALQRQEQANVVWAQDRLLQFKASDIAVAVAIEGGLITPVLKDADSKSLSDLSQEMKDLAARARAKKLQPEEYKGGSFAISNLGMFGVDNFDAVINPPQAAILAVGAGKKKPVVLEDGSLGVSTVMSVTLSCDHRAIDGALGALLLEEIVRNLENPILMLA